MRKKRQKSGVTARDKRLGCCRREIKDKRVKVEACRVGKEIIKTGVRRYSPTPNGQVK